MTWQIADMASSPIFFFFFFFDVLFQFKLLAKFHANIITGPGVMTIIFYKGLTRNPEIRNTPVWVLPNIWRLEQVRIPNLVRMSLIKCYWIPQNVRLIAFIFSELLRENKGRGGGRELPQNPRTPPSKLGSINMWMLWH